MGNQYKKVTIDTVKQYAETKSLTLLSTNYQNAKTKLLFHCERCKEKFETTFDSLKGTKYGCRKCSKTYGIKKGGRKPSEIRPNTEHNWSLIFEKNNLKFIKILKSSPDKSGRVYNEIIYSCKQKFQIDGKPHPIMNSRLTNIERNLREGNPIECKYCSKPNYIAPKGNKNRKSDIIRIEKLLAEKVKKMDARLLPKQTFETTRKKFKVEHISGEIRHILGRNILDGKIENPFTQGERMSQKFTTSYSAVLEVCNKKSLKLITNEDEYNHIVKYDKISKLSPSTRTIKFEYLDEIIEAPIVTVMKEGWLPKFNNIKEEICRYIIEEMLQCKFPNTRPKTLLGVMKSGLELDGFNNDVNGFKIAFEHQGKQHYTLEYNNRPLPNQRENDTIKKQWCKNNNVILIEIPDIGLKTTNESTRMEDVSNLILKTLDKNGYPTSKIKPVEINEDQLYEHIKFKLDPRITKLKNRFAKYGLFINKESLKNTSFIMSVKNKSGIIIYENKGINTLENISDEELSSTV
jgi:hypothetical protein